jgi:predicted ATPase
MIDSLEIHNFTCFEDIKIDFVPGVNIFIGDNGTGKTHILKILYSMLEKKVESSNRYGVGQSNIDVELKNMIENFLPYDNPQKSFLREISKEEAKITIGIDKSHIHLTIGNNKWHTSSGIDAFLEHAFLTKNMQQPDIYIPPKEMLANAPGFRSLYEHREIHIEKIYYNIISKAFLDPLRELNEKQLDLMKKISKTIGGEVTAKGETFFLNYGNKEIEFDLLAEGIRKLALLWLLIRNGSLDKGSTLYWDEPETNLNPSMFPIVVDVLLELERMGVQMFIATHSYYLIKRFDLQRKDHSVKFYTLYKDKKNDGVKCNPADTYLELSPNKLDEENIKIYDLTIEKELFKK